MIDGAKEQWALENKMRAGDVADEAAVNAYFKGGARRIAERRDLHLRHRGPESELLDSGALVVSEAEPARTQSSQSEDSKGWG